MGTITDDKGIKYDQWKIACDGVKLKQNFYPKTWPFDDNSGSSYFNIKHPKSDTQTCKKALAKRFKSNREIRCEHDESKSNKCQCAKNADAIAEVSNNAETDSLLLTATCGDNAKTVGKEMENWKIHCDRNGDGIVNDDEEVGNVNVITKANSNYCNVKKTASDVIKCTKLPTSTCLCDTHFETLDFQKLFKQEAKKDISIKVECINGNSIFDKIRITSYKNGKVCSKFKKVQFKHSNVTKTCQRKLLSTVKSFVKEEDLINSC